MMKMRENVDGVPGTSQYFRLAVMHGGMAPLSEDTHPEYCAHRRACFPNWHRPYLIDFERMMRRADIALGGDGNIGLPYWDWIYTEVNGEVFPKIVRDVLMQEFDSDFFPVAPSRAYVLADIRDDAGMKRLIDSSSVASDALYCLRSATYEQHATTRYSDTRNPSVESPHNSVHGICGGIMASFQSSFHPVFWMHHCNVERLFTAYLALNPDSEAEMRDWARAQRNANGTAGFPDGVWGPYLPFVNHAAGGRTFTARDSFLPSATLNFRFDDLPAAPPPRMREPPYLAFFGDVDVTKLKFPPTLYVFVFDGTAPFEPPKTSGTATALVAHANFAGFVSVFFIDKPGRPCENCLLGEAFDVEVDVTDALRRNRIDPRKAKLFVLAEDRERQLHPLADTGAPTPALVGPYLANSLATAADVVTAGLTNDGGNELAAGAPSVYAGREVITYRVDLSSLPTSLRNKDDSVLDDVSMAFAGWEAATGIDFERKDRGEVDVVLGFSNHSASNAYRFDGAGGALAKATSTSVLFDSAERWAVSGEAALAPADGADFWESVAFYLAPVAQHEIGHVLGLGHSEVASDVMAPYYHFGPKGAPPALTKNDVAAVRAKLGL